VNSKGLDMLSEKTQQQIDHWLKKYPEDQQQSAVIPALHIVQRENGGWLTDVLMSDVADYLGISHTAVYEVATFYDMFDLAPVGKHKISICTNVPCMLSDCEKIAAHVKKRLGIDFGQTTPDGKFTLKNAECLAACVYAPVMQIDYQFYENLTEEKVDHILDTLE
jgi:NADH-quinone oxidoreductase subunit E